ncbi:MAG: M15 family metallopeptidase [Acidimicrobiia bacterium]
MTIVSAGIGDLISSHDASGRVIDTAPDGFAFPLEVFAVDRTTYAAFLPDAEAEVVSDLGFLRVVLSESSARVRRLGEGGSLTFRTPQGRLLTATVEAVLPDTMLGAAEVLTVDGDLLARDRLTPRYALVQGSLSPEALRSGLEAALGIHTPLQVLTVGDTPLARHADSVRPQSHIKLEFGEFAYREGRGRGIEIDPVWEAAHIVETDLPLLGRVKCHRQFAEVLGGVLGALEDAGAGDAIDARSFLGCWNPRWITDRRGLSRHAWGVAADINFGNTLDGGQGSPVHPALLTAMSDAGITSGHEWVQPDPGHFEWVGDGWS